MKELRQLYLWVSILYPVKAWIKSIEKIDQYKIFSVHDVFQRYDITLMYIRFTPCMKHILLIKAEEDCY